MVRSTSQIILFQPGAPSSNVCAMNHLKFTDDIDVQKGKPHLTIQISTTTTRY